MANRDEVLLANIQRALPGLAELLADCSADGNAVDLFYRFYHQSFKLYRLQDLTNRIVGRFRDLAPDGCALNEWFSQIVAEGTGKTFAIEHNRRWPQETRPILEAFFHARMFLELMVAAGRDLRGAPRYLPSGWAAVLYLYNLR
jgi:hypothetical protein